MRQCGRGGLAQMVRKERGTPSFVGRAPASDRARNAARGASKKKDSKCELMLRRTLWAEGLRFRTCVPGLAGRPDIVFPRERVAVFCDGDFLHGRDLESRLARLARGHNAPYWMEKIRSNVLRDRATVQRLRAEGWEVVRLWERDILNDPIGAAAIVASRVRDGQAKAPNYRFQWTPSE
jgi:DNA mismatch endonuclease, patch repair protein